MDVGLSPEAETQPALTPPSPLALAPLSQAWERGWG
jgi:hypothetical protein